MAAEPATMLHLDVQDDFSDRRQCTRRPRREIETLRFDMREKMSVDFTTQVAIIANHAIAAPGLLHSRAAGQGIL